MTYFEYSITAIEKKKNIYSNSNDEYGVLCSPRVDNPRPLPGRSAHKTNVAHFYVLSIPLSFRCSYGFITTSRSRQITTINNSLIAPCQEARSVRKMFGSHGNGRKKANNFMHKSIITKQRERKTIDFMQLSV